MDGSVGNVTNGCNYRPNLPAFDPAFLCSCVPLDEFLSINQVDSCWKSEAWQADVQRTGRR